VTEIGNNAFQDCTSLETILFVGTKKQWEGIRLGTDWQKNIPAKVVHCSDGLSADSDVEI
ncbi:MAG: leucine-rich repeat domain-containing protein, partial [Treponema sp.]|nr:leucine-rich repeat domain-containing protein [Treponema sp.]